jgi:uncharacterized protein (DUF1499 family)
MLTIVLAVAAALLAAALLFFAYGRAETWALFFGNPDLGQFDRADPVRSPSPNDALLCTPGLCEPAKVDVALPEYDVTPAELIARIDDAMRKSGEIQRRVDDGSDPAKARYVTRTPLMRFPDTNSFEAVPLPGGRTGLVAYARAQIGRGDLGVNRARLKKITAALAGG